MKHSLLAFALCIAQIPVVHASEGRVVVVADRATLGRRVRAAIRQQIEKPLASRVAVVKNDTYVRRALNMGFDSTDLAALDTAATVGADVDATHVLVLSGKRKRGRTRLLQATLLDVRTGAAQPVTTIRMGRGRLARAASSRLADGVARKMESAPEPELVAPEPPAPEPEPMVAQPEPTVAVASNALTDSFDGALPSWAESSVSATVTKRHGHKDLGLRIAPAGVALQREAAIRTREGAEAYRHYRTDSFVPGVGLELDIFPFTFDRDMSALDDVGLHARGFGTQVQSHVTGASGGRVSTVWSAEGGLTYRAETHGWTIAPSMSFWIGYSAFSFPVPNEEFPSLMYAGPRANLRLAATIADVVVLFAEGSYMWPLQSGGDGPSLGRLKGTETHAYSGAAGLMLRFGWLELGASARLDRYLIAFGGTARVPMIGELYDARVDDRIISGAAWIGLAL